MYTQIVSTELTIAIDVQVQKGQVEHIAPSRLASMSSVVMLAECPFLFLGLIGLIGLRDSVASVHPIAVDGDSVSVTASEWH